MIFDFARPRPIAGYLPAAGQLPAAGRFGGRRPNDGGSSMHDWFDLIDLINEDDIAWLLTTSIERQVEPGTVLIQENDTIESLYFVLDGLLHVTTASLSEKPLNVLGPGEIIGEISFLDKRRASASVTAVEPARLLELPRARLVQKLRQDRGFTARFYRALAVIMSRRLRHATSALGKRMNDAVIETAPAWPAWMRLAPAVERFKEAMTEAAAAMSSSGAGLSATVAEAARAAWRDLVERTESEIGEDSQVPDVAQRHVGRQVQKELLPYLLLSDTASRMFYKPRGRVDEFDALERMCRNEPSGSGPLGKMVDEIVLELAVPRAVRERRRRITEEIVKTVEQSPEGPVQVTAMHCGPALEMIDAYEALRDPSRLEATLLDVDVQALAYVSRQLEQKGVERHAKIVNENIIYLTLGRKERSLTPQDLIYGSGLLDVVSDKMAVRLLNYLHGLLRPGGRLLLGAMNRQCDGRALLDHVLEWRLVYRTEEEVAALLSQSAFEHSGRTICHPQQGGQFLAECVRAK
jgi:CRP-like cAMP-binding protein